MIEIRPEITEDHHMTGRVNGGFGRIARMLPMVAVLLPVLAMGCKSTKSPTVEQLQRENEELRDREAQLQAALADAEQRGIASEDERQRLQAELDKLRGQRTATTSTGFENVPGARTSMRGSDIVVDVAGDVLFASGSVTLRSDAKSTLDRIADVIKSRYPGNEIQIAGHTDSDPIKKSQWKTNERLSAERALAVEEYLSSRGVSSDRMYVAGFGAAKPKSSKKDSRRVEIVVLGS